MSETTCLDGHSKAQHPTICPILNVARPNSWVEEGMVQSRDHFEMLIAWKWYVSGEHGF